MKQVTTELEGKSYTGTYTITNTMITVYYEDLRPETTQLGGSAGNPESLARIMLSEMIRKAHES